MLDPNLNRIPENAKKIHLIAVCGTAMGALAAMLKELGYEVTGSDAKVYPPMSDFLARKNIEVKDGFHGDNISDDTDLVVVGNAVTKLNPEAESLREKGIPYCSMPQAINRFVAEGKQRLVITGCHGKTTTSSLLAWIFHNAGLDPSFMIGGILKNFDSNYRLGKGDHIVLEGDEYDTAFFDKGPKFLHYPPEKAVVTSIEFDHADIFENLESVKDAFRRFIRKVPEQSTVFAYDNDENIREIVPQAACPVRFYGKAQSSDWRLGNIAVRPPETIFEILEDQASLGEFKTPMMGEHNLLNALSVVAVCKSLGLSDDEIRSGLATFQGVRRRQEIRGVKNGVTVMDDFAHHPTAVRETIRAVRPFFPDGKLVAVFEPRTNTSMRDVFQDVYPRCFDQADVVCIRRPPLLQKIPEGHRFSSEKLVQDLKTRGLDAHYFAETDSIVEFVKKIATSGDLILVMSNGAFDNIHDRLLKKL